MKNQYVGDVNDYRKYALLRALQRGSGLRRGVCWMLTPDDGGPDGAKRSYLNAPQRWREHDADLFDALVHAEAEQQRHVRAVQAVFGPETVFMTDVVPDDLAGRQAYFMRCKRAFYAAQLIFFDPDNGLEVGSVRKGARNSSKYLYFDELRSFLRGGKSALVYQHYPRRERRSFEDELGSRLQLLAPGLEVFCFSTQHVAFLLAVAREHEDLARTAEVLMSRSHADMLSGRRLAV